MHLNRPDEALRLVHLAHAAAAGSHSVSAATSCCPATTPPLVAHVGDAAISGYQGVAHYELASTERDPRAAGRAVPLLRHAVDHLGPDYARPRALYLPDLAGAHAIAGDTDTAVSIGHQAVDAVTAVHSSRAYDRLRVLNTVLEPLHTSTGVAELRDRLVTTAVRCPSGDRGARWVGPRMERRPSSRDGPVLVCNGCHRELGKGW